MSPVIAIIGRANVGKSTLFNVLSHTKDALVYDKPGVTRDRKYAFANYNNHPYIVIDTSGISKDFSNNIAIDNNTAEAQSLLAIEEANLIYFVVDAKSGLTSEDYYIAELLRSKNKLDIVLVVNKTDGIREEHLATEFYCLGFHRFFLITANHRRGISRLLDKTLLPLYQGGVLKLDKSNTNLNFGPGVLDFSLIGRPNVGKSTLINTILDEQRVIVGDEPGTTVDTIATSFSRCGKDYVIIDTAGVRRRSNIKQALEKFSVIKTLQVIQTTSVIVIMIDAKQGITDQDLRLISFVLKTGRSFIIAVNKYDGITQAYKAQLKAVIKNKLLFLRGHIDIHFISAYYRTNIDKLFQSLGHAYESIYKKISTPVLTKVLNLAVEKHKPPIIGKTRIKLKYAHMGGHNPPTIVIHGNQVNRLPKSYRVYLEKFFQEALNIVGIIVKLFFKQPENPYHQTNIRSNIKNNKKVN